MGYHYNSCSPAVQFRQKIHYFISVIGIKVSGGLIGKDKIGIGNNGTGNGNPLLLTT